jgi:hypothetical protein
MFSKAKHDTLFGHLHFKDNYFNGLYWRSLFLDFGLKTHDICNNYVWELILSKTKICYTYSPT